MDTDTRLTRISQWFRELKPWVLDAWIGTAFTVFGLLGLFSEAGPAGAYRDPDALAVLLALVASLPYFARRRAPVVVLATNILGICALGIIGYPFNVQAQMVLVGIESIPVVLLTAMARHRSIRVWLGCSIINFVSSFVL